MEIRFVLPLLNQLKNFDVVPPGWSVVSDVPTDAQ